MKTETSFFMTAVCMILFTKASHAWKTCLSEADRKGGSMERETIAAISTGMTNAGIGIVRISGKDAFSAADRVFRGKEKITECMSHTIHYGYIKDGDETVDQVLVMVMKGPRTFTGEDTVEINCHGGTYVVSRVLDTVLKQGVRPAEPGEFTKRAFLNGKMDLSQAEAVGELISSSSDYALKNSISQLKGSIKNKISDIRNNIIYNTAYIESAIDDPEHYNLEGFDAKLKKKSEEIIKEIKKLMNSYRNGKVFKEGIQTVIVGKPNAGKSSLLNVLAGHERAIVTEIEGTTRDVIEEQISLQGITLNVVDTAGIRQTDDRVEKIGVDRAVGYVRNADLVIYVADSSRNLDENDEKILDMIYDKKKIILLNKSDLETVVTREMIADRAGDAPVIEISAAEETGIEELGDTIKSMFLKGEISFDEEVYITSARQKNALSLALESMEKVVESIENGMPEDFYSIDLMDAYESLGSITGEAVGEDLVNEIFSRFCMGK